MYKKYLIIVAVIVLVFLGFLVFKKDTSAKNLVKNYISLNSDLSEVSVYVEDLTTGKSYGINEENLYTPASIFKVPTVMAYLQASQKYPKLLTQEIIYTPAMYEVYKTVGISQEESGDNLEVGRSYTALELIRKTIEESNNQAVSIMRDITAKQDVDILLETLGINLYDDSNTKQLFSYFLVTKNAVPYITPEAFNKLMVSLYKGSYTDRKTSDILIEMLKKSEFKDGIRAGVPEAVPVAHKFGIYNTINSDSVGVGLNDCGIVYSDNPYTICVMLIAKDMQTATSAMQDISAIIYKEHWIKK